MRRVILAIVSTAIGLVFLLSFKTHTQSALGTPAAALGTPTPGSGAGTASASAAPSGGQDVRQEERLDFQRDAESPRARPRR